MISRRQFLEWAAVSAAGSLSNPGFVFGRQVALVVEASGIDPTQGHRIIEIAAVELGDRDLTGRRFHLYLDPECDICPGAEQVHGLGSAMLDGMPKFSEIAAEFLDFVAGAELIVVNKPFHIGFANAELGRLKMAPLANASSTIREYIKAAKHLCPRRNDDLESLQERYSDQLGRNHLPTMELAELIATTRLEVRAALG